MENNNNQDNNLYNDQTQAGQPLPPTNSFWGNLPPPQVPFQGNYPPPPQVPFQGNYPPPPQVPFQGNYPPSIPGQFHYQTVPAPQPPQKRNIFQWYKRQKKGAKIGIGCGTLFLALCLCICSAAAIAPPVLQKNTAQVPTSTLADQPTHVASVATSQPTHQTAKPTPVPTLKPTNTPVPTIVPTLIPTAIPTQPAPTQPPVATPVPTQPPATGLNGNPWGYNLNAPGNDIYNPPAAFCNYFDCIASFWNNTNGYVDECVDGTYSHSGGVRGACSRHGGEAQPLYSH